MNHVSMKLRVLQRFCKNSDLFLSINFGFDSPVGIQIKIQIGKISELDSNLKACLKTSYLSVNEALFE